MATKNSIRRRHSDVTRVRIGFDPEKGRTKQSHKDECDINQIMARFQRTGAITHFNKFSAHYEDLTGFDYTEAMQQVAEAQSMFNELPSSLRDRFQHDPANFLDFVQNPDNATEARELGLLSEDSQAGLPPVPGAVAEGVNSDATASDTGDPPPTPPSN